MKCFLIIGDFNCKIHEESMSTFCQIYDFKNLINDPSCDKNLKNPVGIDLTTTNKPKGIQNSIAIETGFSDFYKMKTTVLKTYFKK